MSFLFGLMKIALYVHQPICAVDSINGIIKSLSPHFEFKLFSRDWVSPKFFKDVDIVCFPGGFGDCDRYDTIMKWNAESVKEFVNNGGKYLGICMGAYWADKDYLDLLKDARVVQYIKQPGTCTRRPHPKAMPVLWNNQPERMYFYDGPAITGTGFKTIATYSNGDAMSIVQDNIGLIGCHLESDEWWYNKKYLQPYWHHGRHNNMLLEFVKLLCSA